MNLCVYQLLNLVFLSSKINIQKNEIEYHTKQKKEGVAEFAARDIFINYLFESQINLKTCWV